MISNTATTAGKTVTFHVWILSGTQISSIQPMCRITTGPGAGLGGDRQLQTNAWNTITVAVPSNAATPLNALGVQFSTSSSWTGTCHVDSIG